MKKIRNIIISFIFGCLLAEIFRENTSHHKIIGIFVMVAILLIVNTIIELKED